jgi:hypothetical protein
VFALFAHRYRNIYIEHINRHFTEATHKKKKKKERRREGERERENKVKED